MPAEVVFSAAGLLVSKLRSALCPSNVDMCIFLSKNDMLPSAQIMLLEAQQEPQINPQEILPVEVATEPDMTGGNQPTLV